MPSNNKHHHTSNIHGEKQHCVRSRASRTGRLRLLQTARGETPEVFHR